MVELALCNTLLFAAPRTTMTDLASQLERGAMVRAWEGAHLQTLSVLSRDNFMHRQILLAETDGLNSSTLFPQAIQLYSHARSLQNTFVARCGYCGGDMIRLNTARRPCRALQM